MKLSSLLLLLVAVVGLQFGFNNCAPKLNSASWENEEASTFASETLTTDTPVPAASGSGRGEEAVVLVTNEKILTADQINRSLSALTGVSPTANGVATEFNARSVLFPDNFEIKSMTSPMLIGLANLSGRYCEQAISAESSMASDQRKLFKAIDFTKTPVNVTDMVYETLIRNLASRFWAREITMDERMLLMEARQSFVQSFQGNPSTSQTRALALFTCTAMLSALDSITF